MAQSETELTRLRLESFLAPERDTAEHVRRHSFAHYVDPLNEKRVTSSYSLANATGSFNLEHYCKDIERFLIDNGHPSFRITSAIIRADTGPSLVIEWNIDIANSVSGLSRKRKVLAAEEEKSEPVLKRVKEVPTSECAECKKKQAQALSDTDTVLLSKAQRDELERLALPKDTTRDLACTLRRINILTGHDTPVLDIEIAKETPFITIYIQGFDSMDLAQWRDVYNFVRDQKAYSSAEFVFSPRRNSLSLSLRHKNPIFN